ncbi:ZIP family metal transporter [Desertibaculum subflavum]|uniref:ZIP family metal transporter n=1 Tax=Desertibaculum subflavum TaxID=2268458 RepID=UPI000E66C693
MSSEVFVVAAIGAAAAIASVGGGLVALWRKPTTLFMSIALGFASGVLLATTCFSMLPEAVKLGSLPMTVGGFAVGFAVIYAFDLFIHRGAVAGEKAEQRRRVKRFHRAHPPRGSMVTVLAGGTGVEELIEGLSIGVGSAINPNLGLLVALAIAIDNFSEGLAIGEVIRGTEAENGSSHRRRILLWTGGIGLAIFTAALAGWFFLRELPKPALGFLFGTGAGGMLYLTVTNLLPEAEERQYQQLAAVMLAIGFAIVFVLSKLVEGSS